MILGIDPGIARVGWAVIKEQHNRHDVVDYGCFETLKETAEEKRLLEIYEFLAKIIKTHRPDIAVIEKLFFATNAKTAMMVGQARGAILLTLAHEKVAIVAYTPLQVKQAMTGYGAASKEQVGQLVRSILHLSQVPKPDDAADALAIALTHAFSYKFREGVNSLI